ncbi:MAG: hypothetical protein HY791_00730 [Deltaproteobacteria bacterium]|nr:hypothetical protein [Deltaproteobacteria bacterium]
MLVQLLAAIAITSSLPTETHGGPETSEQNGDSLRYYYFNPDGLGAHAFQTPISLVIAGGFSPFFERRIDAFDYESGAKKLVGQLTDPFNTIADYGIDRFLLGEFIPNPGYESGQWVPNYTWHLVGGGFRNRQLREYFHHRGATHPRLYSWLVSYASHLLNELIEAERYGPGAVDGIADLYFFDWVGKLIFDLDAVNEVATEIFHLTDWTTQTQWIPRTSQLMNIGQLYWLRLQLFGPLSLSALTGELTNTVNLTFELGSEQLSLGLGLKPNAILESNSGTPEAEALHVTFGVYLSRADNPVVVATYESSYRFAESDTGRKSRDDDIFVMNVYPGWFDWGEFAPGFSLGVRREAIFLALSHGAWPIGISVGPLGRQRSW